MREKLKRKILCLTSARCSFSTTVEDVCLVLSFINIFMLTAVISLIKPLYEPSTGGLFEKQLPIFVVEV
ncbi:hypothetical protein P8452_62046 [Trifolium repens]|nr:hypothetical protein P8452_62046 [Trifolium repens]